MKIFPIFHLFFVNSNDVENSAPPFGSHGGVVVGGGAYLVSSSTFLCVPMPPPPGGCARQFFLVMFCCILFDVRNLCIHNTVKRFMNTLNVCLNPSIRWGNFGPCSATQPSLCWALGEISISKSYYQKKIRKNSKCCCVEKLCHQSLYFFSFFCL
jgi:hypothetical protein